MSIMHDEGETRVLVEDLVSGDSATRAAFDQQSAVVEAGNIVRRLRVGSGLSQRDLAERVGTSQAHLSELERGLGTQGPTYALLNRIVHACGATLSLNIEPAHAAATQQMAVMT